MPPATPVLPTLASYNYDEIDLVESLLPILQKEVVEGANQYYFDIVESLAVPFRLRRRKQVNDDRTSNSHNNIPSSGLYKGAQF